MSQLSEDVPNILSLLKRKLELKGLKDDLHLLQVASTSVIEEDYDNWNGGQYYYTLYLDIPIEKFVEIEDDLSNIEKRILKEIKTLRRGVSSNEHISAVTIRSAPDSSLISPHLANASGDKPVPTFWRPDCFRMFISHVATHKTQAQQLKIAFIKYGITSFVAHDDIEPTKKWLEEIQTALYSMDAIVALITTDFITSKWCDQEVGIAMGLGRLVVPVRVGADPYGFLGKYQGLSSHGKTMEQVAREIFSIISTHEMTQLKVASVLVEQLYTSNTYAESKNLMDMLERLPVITIDHAKRIRQALADNAQVINSFYVPDRIKRLLKRHGHMKPS
jgi:TIR domain